MPLNALSDGKCHLRQKPGEVTEFTIIAVMYSLRPKRHSIEYALKCTTEVTDKN